MPPYFVDRSLFQYAYIGFLHISQVRLQINSLMLAKETFFLPPEHIVFPEQIPYLLLSSSIKIFSNLKILSLGEWCMAPGFDALIFLLQHSPVIERLFLQLKLVCVTCIFVVGVFMPEHVLNNSFVDLHKKPWKQVSNYREDHLPAKTFKW